jgi:hypothetical protein
MEAAPDVAVEPPPKETAPETGPDVADVEAEPTCVAMLDEAGSGAILTPDSLSFGTGGLVPCGTQATPLTLTLSNTTCASFTWTSSLSSGASYTVSPAMGTLAPGVTQPIQITPSAIPTTSSVSAGLYDGTLSIMTSAANDTTHLVPLHMTAQGVILTTTVTGNAIAFGGVAVGETGTSQLTIANSGNISAPVTFSVTTPAFKVSSVPAITASNAATPTVTFSPTAVQAYTDTIVTSVPTGTATCAPMPTNIALSGSGTTGVSVSPTLLPFGLVFCGGTAAAYQTLTITNSGPTATFTPTFMSGASYTLTDGAGNAIPAGQPQTLGATATIRVVPNAITIPSPTTVNGFGDALIISTTATGDVAHNITLTETAEGAIFTLSPPDIAVTVGGTASAFEGFTVSNTGNYAAAYTLTATPSGSFSSNIPGGTLGAMGTGSATQTGTLTCTGAPLNDAGQGSQVLGQLTLTPAVGAVLCQDPPSPMPLSVSN